MPDVLEGDGEEEEAFLPADDEGLDEEAGEVQGKTTVHVEREGNSRLISITEMTAKTVLAILDTVVVKGSASKFQVAIAQQEIEKELALLDQPSTSLNRAQRRSQKKTTPRLLHS